jgi:hypothetical protein
MFLIAALLDRQKIEPSAREARIHDPQLRQAWPLVLAVSLQGDAFGKRQWRPVVVVYMVIVVSGFRRLPLCHTRWIAEPDRLTGCGVCVLPASDERGDRFLGRRSFLPGGCGVASMVLAAFTALILSAS